MDSPGFEKVTTSRSALVRAVLRSLPEGWTLNRHSSGQWSVSEPTTPQCHFGTADTAEGALKMGFEHILEWHHGMSRAIRENLPSRNRLAQMPRSLNSMNEERAFVQVFNSPRWIREGAVPQWTAVVVPPRGDKHSGDYRGESQNAEEAVALAYERYMTRNGG